MQHKARKRFGQHFLTDAGVLQRIAAAIHPSSTDTILEIGPGQGALTAHLINQCKAFIAIELDRDLAKTLPLSFPVTHLAVIQDDALSVALDQLSDQPVRLVGNLPYNISTPLIFHFLQYIDTWKDAHIMVQKEVADRLVATPDDSNHGRLSVMLQAQCNAEILFDIGPDAFSPPPKVNSSILRIVPLEKPALPAADLKAFSQLVKTGFSQRRKTLNNNFKGILSKQQIEQAGINPQVRAQTLSVDAWVDLYSVWRDIKSRV